MTVEQAQREAPVRGAETRHAERTETDQANDKMRETSRVGQATVGSTEPKGITDAVAADGVISGMGPTLGRRVLEKEEVEQRGRTAKDPTEARAWQMLADGGRTPVGDPKLDLSDPAKLDALKKGHPELAKGLDYLQRHFTGTVTGREMDATMRQFADPQMHQMEASHQKSKAEMYNGFLNNYDRLRKQYPAEDGSGGIATNKLPLDSDKDPVGYRLGWEMGRNKVVTADMITQVRDQAVTQGKQSQDAAKAAEIQRRDGNYDGAQAASWAFRDLARHIGVNNGVSSRDIASARQQNLAEALVTHASNLNLKNPGDAGAQLRGLVKGVLDDFSSKQDSQNVVEQANKMLGPNAGVEFRMKWDEKPNATGKGTDINREIDLVNTATGKPVHPSFMLKWDSEVSNRTRCGGSTVTTNVQASRGVVHTPCGVRR